MRLQTLLYIFPVLLIPFRSWGQNGYRFGVQLGPIFTASELSDRSGVVPGLAITPGRGAAAGITLHYGFQYGSSADLALRLGVNFGFVQHNFTIDNDLANIKGGSLITPFEVPLLLSVRTKIGRKVYLREALGGSPDFIPTYLITEEQAGTSYYLRHTTDIPFKFAVSFVAQGGLEWEFRKGNVLDIGLSYKQGFTEIMQSELAYTHNGTDHYAEIVSKGGYLSLLISYYFAELKLCPIFN